MKKIRVLQFPIANAKGGITQYALKNWEFIDKSRFQFDFATLSKKLDFEQELTEQGCKVHYISCYAEDDEKQFIKEIEKIFDEGYDVIHLHTSYWKTFLVEELAIKYGIPKIIVHSHSTMIDILDDKKRKEAIIIHNERKKQFSTLLATDFCACSQIAGHWLFGEQIPKNKIRIMKNAIDVNEFSYNIDVRKKYRKKFGLDGCFVLGHVGRFVFQKNHDFLIDIFKNVSEKISDAVLVLIGTGKLEEKIRGKVKLYGLEDKVVFMGKRNDVNYLLQAMDLFLLPSRFEGLPIVLVEAQTSGIKCLASSVITNEVAITNNIGFLSSNINEWSERIVYYSKGYKRVKNDEMITKAGYNIRNQIKKVEQLYK